MLRRTRRRGPRKRPRLVRVRTRDGWRLALYRYASAPGVARWGPLVLCHGLGANRYNLDAPPEEISLARYLHGRGHEVWVVELRGAGRSRAPGMWRRGWDFDDYVHKDLPAIIRGVLKRTQSASLHWVGHSLGGMLAYAAMMHYDRRIFRSVTTIGSPSFNRVGHPAIDRLYALRGLLKVIPWVPYRRVAGLVPYVPPLSNYILSLLSAPDNIDPRHVKLLAPRVLHDLPAPLLAQFAEWYGRVGGFARNDGLLEYWEHLDRVVAPLLVIAGGGDQLSPLGDIEAVFEAVGAQDKRLVVADRAHGYTADYGHVDLIVGLNARREIYPLVSDWIESH